MFKDLAVTVRMTVVLVLLTGLAYPGVVAALSELIFPKAAKGSLITEDGRIIGSELIGQKFSRPEYFHGRPSAAGDGYDGANSGGSSLGPTNRKLADRVRADVVRFRADNPKYPGPLPADLLTASASGLDPHISPASADAQIARVAQARKVPEEQIRKLCLDYTEGRQFGILGEPRINVLKLNLALDRLYRSAP